MTEAELQRIQAVENALDGGCPFCGKCNCKDRRHHQCPVCRDRFRGCANCKVIYCGCNSDGYAGSDGIFCSNTCAEEYDRDCAVWRKR
jgi:hypothetical protein